MLQMPLQSDTFERYADEYDEYQHLITKFRSPVLGRTTQTRTRLLTLLHQGLAHSLLLLSAPAGSGKTTLLSQWAQSLADEHISAVWVSLDKSDNEPSRFWNVLFTAMAQKISVFRSVKEKNDKESISTLLTLLINISVTHQEPVVLLLDDYHTITDSVIQKQMTYLIEHLPAHMHIVISTRVDPHLPLARLRMRGRVLEVRMDALRFTDEEAMLFLRETLHFSLTDAESMYLVKHIDGWIAGLCLAGCALYEPLVAESVSVAACGSQRYILDYILEEILLAQEEHIQAFLLRTAFLSHFSTALCDAVLERQDSWQILQQMERANLFLIAENHEHSWYHYQTLFAEALRCRLERTESDVVAGLHRRASHWYEQHGFLVDAIEHLCELHEWENAAALIGRMLQQQSSGDADTPSLAALQNLLVRLPEASVQLRPYLYSHTNIFAVEERNVHTLSPLQKKNMGEGFQIQQITPPQQLIDPLSQREIEVLGLLAQGDSNAKIAHNLVIAPATAKRHVSNILSKLQAANRTQAVASARQLGLVY